MRIVVVHNRYRSEMPSGENRVVDDEVAVLRAAGHDVVTLFRHSDSIAQFSTLRKAGVAVSTVYGPSAVKELRQLIDAARPDVLHLHNAFPLISPWIIREAKRRGIPVVHTVHNYRQQCPAGTFYRDQRTCTECMGKSFSYPAVLHGCYRGSRAQSVAMATSGWVHQSSWALVDRYLATSEFVGDFLLESGVPRDRITVKPNFTRGPASVSNGGTSFAFIGRLGEEKGLRLLLDAWGVAGLAQQLTIVGDGPLAPEVQRAAASDPSITWVGAVPPAAVATHLEQCGVVVIPSVTFEGFPMLVAEAFAHGRPVVATRIGSLPGLIGDQVGWLAEPTPAALAEGLSAATDPDARRRRGLAARRTYEAALSPEAALDSLEDAYRAVMSPAVVQS